MFNDSDHETNTSLSKDEIKAALDKIQSDLEDAFDHLRMGGNGWYSLDRLHGIAETADAALRGETP